MRNVMRHALLGRRATSVATYGAQLFIDGNGRSDGTDLTAGEFGAGDRGTIPGGGNYALFPNGGVPTSWMQWAANQNARIANVAVTGDATYGVSTLSKSIRIDHNYWYSTAGITNLSGSKEVLTSMMFIPGLSATGAANGLHDVTSHICLGGFFSVAQIITGGNVYGTGNQYVFNIESFSGGATAHTGSIVAVPDTPYRLVFYSNFAAGSNQSILKIYSITGILLGTITAPLDSTGNDVFQMIFGQNQAQSEAGKYSYFQDIVFNHSANNVLPYGPI